MAAEVKQSAASPASSLLEQLYQAQKSALDKFQEKDRSYVRSEAWAKATNDFLRENNALLLAVTPSDLDILSQGLEYRRIYLENERGFHKICWIAGVGSQEMHDFFQDKSSSRWDLFNKYQLANAYAVQGRDGLYHESQETIDAVEAAYRRAEYRISLAYGNTSPFTQSIDRIDTILAQLQAIKEKNTPKTGWGCLRNRDCVIL